MARRMIAQIAAIIFVRRVVSLAAMSHVLCDMAQIMIVNGAISTLALVIHTMFLILKLSLLNFCDSSTGTGCNVAGAPCNFNNNATVGNCIEQIRVKDP